MPDFTFILAFFIAFIVLMVVGFLMKSFGKLFAMIALVFLLYATGLIIGPNDIHERFKNTITKTDSEIINKVNTELANSTEEIVENAIKVIK